jgi:formate-dependent phosphoribosylglycinamide formyltransferase (GAR transformylase)
MRMLRRIRSLIGSHVIDMTDSDAIKMLIALEQPHFIIPEIEAIATQALADIEARRTMYSRAQCQSYPVDHE